MNRILNSFIKWVALSSANPSQASLSVKGALVLVIPYVIAAEGLTHVSVADSATLTLLVNDIAIAVYFVTGAIGIFMTIYGLIRKIFLTMAGKNQAADQGGQA